MNPERWAALREILLRLIHGPATTVEEAQELMDLVEALDARWGDWTTVTR